MAEVAATALLKFVFDKLSSGALTEFGLLVGVDKQLRKLESTLSALQDVLEDAEARQVKEKALKGWLRKLKDVAYDADDVLDEFTAEAMKWRPEIERRKKDKVRSFFLKPNSLVLRHKIARRIKEIRERLDDIAEERTQFHLRVEDRKEEIRPREPTGSFVNESEVYGRQFEREKITDFLINPSWSEDNLGVMAIVGLGGLGKTTVAQLVYNDDRVCEHFDQRMWVCVSDEFDTRRLSRSIIESATREECNLLEMDSVQYSLRELLRGKRFLLVLDDVWNENHEKWDGFRTLLTSGAKGSKIVVTTRSDRVASIMGTAPPHFLTGLSEDDCWSLFERRAFGSGEAAKNPNLVAIGKEIVKKCGGVPLAAKALGSLMRFKRGESEWLSVKNNEIWKLSDDENEILPALMLSYNHLPSRLKQCFAYCSIFPKDYEVRKEELVQLWIAEGFIRSSDMNTQLEDVGYQSVDELLSRSLFQNGEEDNDGVVRQVKMHDLVHDLARSVAGDECSIIDAGTGRGVSESLRYSSFLCNKEISAILEPLDQAKKLRTFYLIQLKGESEEQDKIHELPHVLFFSLKLLRALHMSNYPMKGLSDSIKKLKHLRYLNLSGTDLETLPPCIGMLQNLQTLNLSDCKLLRALPDTICDLHNLSTLDLQYCLNLLSLPSSIGSLTSLQMLNLWCCQFIRALPESVSSLLNLRKLELRYCYMLCELPENTRNMRNLVHLDIHSCCGLTCMPAGIGEMNRLRTLPIFILGGKNRSSLEELGGLNLEGELKIKNLENVRNAAETRGAKLKEKQRLKSLRLEWDMRAYVELKISREGIDRDLGDAIEALVMRDWDADAKLAEDTLQGLQPHTDLEVLCIEGYLGRGLPRWMMELSLPNLVEVSLTFCFSCECLPAFGKLPYLKVLKLSELPAVKILDSEFYGGDAAFPLLEEFELGSMTALEEWMGPSGGEVMPCLSKLSLQDCPELKALPSSFPSVKELSMYVDDAMLLSSLQDGAFPNLSRLNIGNCDDGDEDDMPEVLTERMASIRCWSVQTKAVPRGNDSATMYGTGMMDIYGGTNIFEIPLW